MLIGFYRNIGHLFYLMLLNEQRVTKMSLELIIFCSLHFLTGLADESEVALKGWDKLLYEDNPVGSVCYGDILEVILVSTG